MTKTSNSNNNENKNESLNPAGKKSGRKPASKAKVTVEIKEESPVDEAKLEEDDNDDDLYVDDNTMNIQKQCTQNAMMSVPYRQNIDIGPNANFAIPASLPTHIIPGQPKSNYFKTICDKASDIIKALISNDMYVDSIKIESMILSETGQFIAFSNEDTGLSSDIINLNCYYPYMSGDDLSLIKVGWTTIESPDSMKRKINNAIDKRNSIYPAKNYNGPAQMPNTEQYTDPVTYNHNTPNIIKARLSIYDYTNGLCSPHMYSEHNKAYYPICIWDLVYFESIFKYNNREVPEIYPRWIMPEKAALKMLKGKAFPLAFVGTVPEETISMTQYNTTGEDCLGFAPFFPSI